MTSPLTSGLLLAATALGGVAAGTSFDKSIVQLTAWRRVGATSWAAYSREADLGNGLIWYPPLGICSLLFNVAAALALRRDPTAPRSARFAGQVAALLAIGHMLATARAAPNMLRIRRIDDPEAPQRALEGFTRWQTVRTVLDALLFAANIWSLRSATRA